MRRLAFNVSFVALLPVLFAGVLAYGLGTAILWAAKRLLVPPLAWLTWLEE